MHDADDLNAPGHRLLESCMLAMGDQHGLRLRRDTHREHGHAQLSMLQSFGEVTATPERLLIHPASPFGLAAVIAVPAVCLGIGGIVLRLAARARRRAWH